MAERGQAKWFVTIMLLQLRCSVKSDTLTELNGAGATFPYEVYLSWMAGYSVSRHKYVKVEMTYEAKGSGHGKERIKGELEPPVDYAGSDSLLTEEDYLAFPDLQMLPMMAGPLVMAFNIPGIESLKLSREALLGIYNGTYTKWDHAIIQTLNKNVTLPHRDIIVTARAEKSGTTEILTKFFSSVSEDWKFSYGTFSAGLNDAGITEYWNSSLIKVFGSKAQGMSDVIRATPYSIGYTSLYSARNDQLNIAHLINLAGFVVDGAVHNVQATMDATSANMDSRLTVDLVDSAGNSSYPLASYTYLIINLEGMTDCDKAVELLRYIEWCLTDDNAHTAAVNRHMTPVSASVRQKVLNVLFSEMTCKGDLVHDMLIKQIQKEENQEKRQMTLVLSITIPLFFVLALVVMAYFLYQKYRENVLLDKDVWKIPISDIMFYIPTRSKSNYDKSNNSQKNGGGKEVMFSGTATGLPPIVTALGAKWNNHSVCIKEMRLNSLDVTKRNTKKHLLELKDSFIHENIVRFFGLTMTHDETYFVRDFCCQGNLADIFRKNKYCMNSGLKASLAYGIVNGMCYLHSNNVVHRRLTSFRCLVDSHWTVKICDWEYSSLIRTMHGKVYGRAQIVDETHVELQAIDNTMAKDRFWTAPEILKRTITNKNYLCQDVYSFGIILNEIFTGEQPFYDMVSLENLTPDEILESVVVSGLRPRHSDQTPTKVKQIIEMAWSEKPASRPTFNQLRVMLGTIIGSKNQTLDYIIESIEEYTASLEEKLEDVTKDVKLLQNSVTKMRCSGIPLALVEGMKESSQLGKMQSFASVSMLHIQMSLEEMEQYLDSENVAVIITDISNAVESFIGDQLNLVERSSSHFILISGAFSKGEDNRVEDLVSIASDVISRFRAILQSHQILVNSASSLDMGKSTPEANFIRCCLHSGPLCGTLVKGTHSDWYAVFGELLTSTKLLTEHCPWDQILISEQTEDLLPKERRYSLKNHTTIPRKDRSSTRTFLLTSHSLSGQVELDDIQTAGRDFLV